MIRKKSRGAQLGTPPGRSRAGPNVAALHRVHSELDSCRPAQPMRTRSQRSSAPARGPKRTLWGPRLPTDPASLSLRSFQELVPGSQHRAPRLKRSGWRAVGDPGLLSLGRLSLGFGLFGVRVGHGVTSSEPSSSNFLGNQCGWLSESSSGHPEKVLWGTDGVMG